MGKRVRLDKRTREAIQATRTDAIHSQTSRNLSTPYQAQERFITCDKYGNVSYRSAMDSTLRVRGMAENKTKFRVELPDKMADLTVTKGPLNWGTLELHSLKRIKPKATGEQLQAKAIRALPNGGGITYEVSLALGLHRKA